MTVKLTSSWDTIFRTFADKLPPIEKRLADRLPVVPTFVRELSELTSDPETPLRKIADVISSDGTLTSILLRFANSAAAGAPGQIYSITTAVRQMGLRRLTNAVLSLALKQAFHTVRSHSVSMSRFRQESVERAAFACHAARILKGDPDTARLAAMIQDLMLPVVTDVWPEKYRRQRSEHLGLSEFERDVFGWDHAGLMASLMKEWCFPTELIVCVMQHHLFDQPDSAPWPLPPELVAVAGASLLPEQMNQTCSVAQKLVRLQQAYPQFNVLEFASVVDEQTQRSGDEVEHHRLNDRLTRILASSLIEDQFSSMLVQRTIGRYTLEAEIGKGAMGIVFRAKHDMMRRPAAIKILDTRKLNDVAVRRFEAEVQLTSQLTSPYTITIYDYGMTPEGFFFYVMEYVDGITLTDLVEGSGTLPEGPVIRLLLQACESLAEAHALNLIHRDIKPDNMMLRLNGIAGDMLKVLDFGMAAALSGKDSLVWGPDVCGGTPLFLAPECILNPAEIDARVDVYALGAVAYFLLTGLPLFDEADEDVESVLQRQINQVPERPSVRVGRQVSADLEDLVMACLEKDRNKRPSSMVELADRIRACQSVVGSLTTPFRLSEFEGERHGLNVPLAPDSLPTPRFFKSTAVML